MTTNENASNAGGHEASLKTTFKQNTNQSQPDSQSNSTPLLCSGYGQFHTNEPGKDNRKPYAQINFKGVQSLVDTPQDVIKQQAQWLIPSTLPTRSFKEQKENGSYYLLWADIDQNPQGIIRIAELTSNFIGGSDYEIYTSKSATQENQKCRVLVPLSKPLSGVDWVVCQEILNDKLQEKDITPDRKSEGAAQLCYLPNRGEFYDTKSKRDGEYFDPMLGWANEIKTRQEEIEQQANELKTLSNEDKSKREAFKSNSDASILPALINASNVAYLMNAQSNNGYTAQDVISEFLQAMQAAGINYSGRIIPDGELHRFHIKGHREHTRNGAYTLHIDHHPAGWFMDFTTDLSQKWQMDGAEAMSSELKAEINKIQRERAAEIRRKQEAAGDKAHQIWGKSRPINSQSEHAYLVNKRIQPCDLREYNDSYLVIPLFDESEGLVSLQFIDKDGGKRFLSGGKKKGCFSTIGEPTPKILICEGFATGASLHEATGQHVIVALDAGNLLAVSEAIRSIYPAHEITICGDNDRSGVGQTKAKEAALAIGGKLLIPTPPGMDWNDFLTARGRNA